VVAAAQLSNRYITSRQLPDKAIDLIDEAASRLRMEIDSSPEEIDQLRRQVDRMTMEQFALEKERTPPARSAVIGSQPRSPMRKKLCEASSSAGRPRRPGLNRVGDIKTEIDQLRAEADKRQREGDLTGASQILYGEIPNLEAELEKASQASQATPMVADEVSSEDIAEIISSWTGIPVGRMMQGESEKLMRMEEELGQAAHGQEQAIRASPTLCGAPVPGSATRTGPPDRSCSSGRPASARPNWPRRWPSSSSTTSAPWSAST
jgi:ATP-dependent Clp protease ATP-binding subunit ClpB